MVSKEPPSTEYLMKSTEFGDTIIGPFKSAQQLERFLDKHDRLFSSFASVYTPREYDALMREPEWPPSGAQPGDNTHTR
jgi:hypothetical protein